MRCRDVCIIFLFLLAIILTLVAVGAILGFVTALYALRPNLFYELSSEVGLKMSLIVKMGVGAAIAALVPVLGGISYALSGTSMMVEVFGMAGTWFWGWVAIAYFIGFLLGTILRHEK